MPKAATTKIQPRAEPLFPLLPLLPLLLLLLPPPQPAQKGAPSVANSRRQHAGFMDLHDAPPHPVLALVAGARHHHPPLQRARGVQRHHAHRPRHAAALRCSLGSRLRSGPSAPRSLVHRGGGILHRISSRKPRTSRRGQRKRAISSRGRLHACGRQWAGLQPLSF
jgi:hypothetical protein